MNDYIFGKILVLFIGFYFQGSWNLKYAPMHSIDDSFLNREVRIDFKSSDKDDLGRKEKVGALEIRGLLSREDFVDILVEGKFVKFRENWNIYPDQGILKEQFLQSTTDSLIKIKKIIIKEISNNSIIVIADLNSKEESRKIELEFEKALIKGILW